MVIEFCGFRHGVIGKELPSDTTLNNMKKEDLIKLLHTAQHNYETLMWFYNNAVKANMAQLNNNSWIPCSKRLPEANGWYLVTNELGVVQQQYWGARHWHKLRDDAVIAWQPLPDPYIPNGGTE